MTDTPDTPPTTDDKPAPTPRRRAPRKTAAKGDGSTTKRTPAKRAAARNADKDAGLIASATDTVGKAEQSTVKAARSAGAAASRTAKKAEDAVADTAKKAGTAIGVVKPRSSKRTTSRTPAKRSTRGARNAPDRSVLDKTADKVGGKWGAAAVVGGLAAAGAAAAALLTLRSSTPKQDEPATPSNGADTTSPATTDETTTSR